MIVAARAVVLLGVVAVVALALGNGLDAKGGALIAGICGLGLLVLGAGRKMREGTVQPRACDACGGLISPNAPYCKHCGARG